MKANMLRKSDTNMERDCEQKSEQWLTLQEASKITGRTPAALRMLIKRNKIVRVKREHKKQREYWLIHREELDNICEHVPTGVNVTQEVRTVPEHLNYVTVEYYDMKRKEWGQEANILREQWEEHRSQLEQGLMMYRYKFEEVDRQLKLLPAPPEVLTKELRQKEATIAQAQRIIQEARVVQEKYRTAMAQLQQKLREEEKAKADLLEQWELAQAELKRPWWKKMFGLKR